MARNSSSKRILILYDKGSIHVATIREHLESFIQYSSFNIEFLPASNEYWEKAITEFDNKYPKEFNYDFIVIHFSVRVSIPGFHIYKPLLNSILDVECTKVIFIQDEYENVECTRRFLDLYKPNIVFTNIPNKSVNKIYPKYRYPDTFFKHNLTGYTGDPKRYSKYTLPYKDKKNLIVYRGRELPPYYGQLGFDKYQIGKDVADYCRSNNIPHDISCKLEDRIYKELWLDFLGSSIATLGTESGSNIFDETGSFKMMFEKAKDLNPDIDNRKFYDKYFSQYDNYVKMNQISPKFFEAISLRTVLILYKGNYSNVIKPGIHYLQLKRDLSNIKDIIETLKDQSKVEKITSQAYKDVIESEKYSYKKFISYFDYILCKFSVYPSGTNQSLKLKKTIQNNIISSPIISKNIDSFHNPSTKKKPYYNFKYYYINTLKLKNNTYKSLWKFRSLLRMSKHKLLRNFSSLLRKYKHKLLRNFSTFVNNSKTEFLNFMLKLKNILIREIELIIRKNRMIYIVIRKIYKPIKRIIANFFN